MNLLLYIHHCTTQPEVAQRAPLNSSRIFRDSTQRKLHKGPAQFTHYEGDDAGCATRHNSPLVRFAVREHVRALHQFERDSGEARRQRAVVALQRDAAQLHVALHDQLQLARAQTLHTCAQGERNAQMLYQPWTAKITAAVKLVNDHSCKQEEFHCSLRHAALL